MILNFDISYKKKMYTHKIIYTINTRKIYTTKWIIIKVEQLAIVHCLNLVWEADFERGYL